VRVAVLVVGAALINLGLYLLMERMVSRDRVRVLDLVDAQVVEFARLPADEETRTKDRRRTPPPKPRELATPRAPTESVANRASLPTDLMAYSVSNLLSDGGGVGIGERIVQGSSEAMKVVMASDLTPLSRFPPQYPPTALQRGLEGWVDLTFIVTEEGTVQDPVVLDATPKNTFEKAALAAVSRWRFRPVQSADGPVAVRVRLHVDFSLPD
jgi:protein TonB